ncbi:MAG TPA: 4-alpha-glucanotransferase, partial [Burkholderiales bacterium]|nr:4-alpha-glucanotransferase [Burkholderiales bacterium]
MNDDALDRLCRVAGIAPGYSDIWGNTRVASDATRRALLAALGITAAENDTTRVLEQEETRSWRRAAPPVVVCRENRLPYRITLTFPESAVDETHAWRLSMESGASRNGEFRARQLELLESRFIAGERHVRVAFDWREALPAGYHRFILQPLAASAAATSLIVVPERCYLPPALREGGRAWGIAAQLYGLVSSRGWGMGDFTDLSLLAEQWGRRGADFIGVNPLHALYPHNPAHASPYSPSSRRFLNPLYLDVEAVEDLHECREARQELRSAAFQRQLQAARRSELVDYPAVARLKLPLLEQLYAHFVERHLRPGSARSRAFREFQSGEGAALRRHALYHALQQHFHDSDPGIWGFPAWPEAYRDPDSREVARFAETHAHRVEFYEYLQWQCDLQLGAVAARCRHLGMEVGLYTDIAVSIDSAGSDAWSGQRDYALGATLGAPPDEINREGQNWGLPPLHPGRLRDAAYAPFIATVRAGMRHAGAVRIDHVMGLYRLFWIPHGGSAADGAYVHYPFEDLLGVLALESQRNRCMVIGEDLGTVPDEVRDGLARTGVLSYRLLLFERDTAGHFRPPRDYPVEALVTATTHDLPTLAGYWDGGDLRLQHSLKRLSDADLAVHTAVRAEDRARIEDALVREHLLPQAMRGAVTGKLAEAGALAIQAFLARTPARLQSVQLEDVFGIADQTNLPGSTEEHPNWRRKLPIPLERMQEDARMTSLAATLSRERPRTAASEPPRVTPVARIPRATYRLQLNREFTFAHAAAIVPYLAELGVSHVYCSPYLRARPGSLHGYDIVDHNTLNPEIGTEADFERFVETLRAHEMGHILDMVPNHVGVMGADNAWWLDVLENGPASAYAGFFDIEWHPPNTDLANKVLVPVLGAHYGAVLDKGEIELKFDAAEGSFSMWYHEHRFPLDPSDYAQLLAAARDAAPEPGKTELAAIADAFARLPGRERATAEHTLERTRGARAGKERLARLVAGDAHAASVVNRTTSWYGDPKGREALHELLERQPYRLTYWRVASDEINYRRFFDVNDLAALRMEDEAVFEATHRFVLSLAAAGKVDGLRIDHPDGLYDPAAYLSRLQLRYREMCAGPARMRGPLALYVVVEKIAAPHEELPENWAVHGTTGYRFAALVNGLFVSTGAREEMERIYREFVPEAVSFARNAYDGRHVILRGTMASALTMLVAELLRIARAN